MPRRAYILLGLIGACTSASYSGGAEDGGAQGMRRGGDAAADAAADATVDPSADLRTDAASAAPEGDASQGAVTGEPDASGQTTAEDAAVVEPGQPESASVGLLRGKYVVRTRFYQRDDPSLIRLSHEMVQLAEISGSEGALTVRFKLCRQLAQLRGILNQDAQAASPRAWPERNGRIVIDGPLSFHVEAEPWTVGYGPTPAGCSPGTSIASTAAWTSGTCDCPGSEEALPVSTNDCRVTDPDQDNKAGYTVVASNGNQDYARNRESSQVVAGEISVGKLHVAQYRRSSDFFAFQCSTGWCSQVKPRECAQATTSVRFAPLEDAQFDCDAALDALDRGSVLSNDRAEFPSGC